MVKLFVDYYVTFMWFRYYESQIIWKVCCQWNDASVHFSMQLIEVNILSGMKPTSNGGHVKSGELLAADITWKE